LRLAEVLQQMLAALESPMPEAKKARAVGINHVALEVGDIEEALAFYGRLFDFRLRGKSETSAFIDLGDQFLALQKGRRQPADDGRHLGLVADDKDAVREALADADIKPLPGPFLDFLDPWGNRIEIVAYDNIQFTKAPNVLRGMGMAHLSKKRLKRAIGHVGLNRSSKSRRSPAASTPVSMTR
jgi:catechol 2,3-dioxygenase-like lactoylglutathione lyase family enzyme